MSHVKVNRLRGVIDWGQERSDAWGHLGAPWLDVMIGFSLLPPAARHVPMLFQ